MSTCRIRRNSRATRRFYAFAGQAFRPARYIIPGMKQRALHGCLIALALSLAACSKPAAQQAPANSAPQADARLQGAYRTERNGWVFVHLQGPPATLGFQHGYLLAAETAELLRVFKAFTTHQTKRDWAFYRETCEKMLWPKMELEYQQE